MIVFRIDADEGALRAIPSRLTQLGADLSDMRPYWPAALVEARGVLRDAFESEGATGQSGRWPALDPSYARWKARKYPGAKILERTGRLRASLRSSSEQTVTSEPQKLTIRSEVPYGGYHQRGIGQKRRPPWSPTRADANRIVSAITREIRRRLVSTFQRAA